MKDGEQGEKSMKNDQFAGHTKCGSKHFCRHRMVTSFRFGKKKFEWKIFALESCNVDTKFEVERFLWALDEKKHAHFQQNMNFIEWTFSDYSMLIDWTLLLARTNTIEFKFLVWLKELRLHFSFLHIFIESFAINHFCCRFKTVSIVKFSQQMRKKFIDVISNICTTHRNCFQLIHSIRFYSFPNNLHFSLCNQIHFNSVDESEFVWHANVTTRLFCFNKTCMYVFYRSMCRVVE